MRFQVPQFIDVEDKIFGPFTLKQFIYLAGGGALCFMLFQFTPKILAFPLMVPVAVLTAALAFYRFNNKPFISVVESAFWYVFGGKLYIWKKEDKKIIPKTVVKKTDEPLMYVPKLSDSKLKDLTWSLDINESLNPVTHDAKHPPHSS